MTIKLKPFYTTLQVRNLTGWRSAKAQDFMKTYGYQIAGKRSSWVIDREKFEELMAAKKVRV